MNNQRTNIVGLKELRENVNDYIKQVARGKSFIVVKKSKPVFRLTAVEEDEELWETVIDFTAIKKGGVSLQEVLSRL